MILQPYKEKIAQMCQENDVSYLGLFGSYSRGEENPQSDVDLLVEYSQRVSMFDHVRLQRKLAELLMKNVDLVTKKSLHPYIKDYILKDLQTIYAKR
jgi:hypothetical protein